MERLWLVISFSKDQYLLKTSTQIYRHCSPATFAFVTQWDDGVQTASLRLWLLTIGRFNANLTRSIVQKIAITGKPKTSYRFKRVISVDTRKVTVTDFILTICPLSV